MPFVKSLSVGNGDMYYIVHASKSFSIIDCFLSDDNKEQILAEVKQEQAEKGCTRFISTHPDEDHIAGLKDLDEALTLRNFYCVKNEATKKSPSESFEHYCQLRDGPVAFHIRKGCKRKWMNEEGDGRGSAGIHILWPDTGNADYMAALQAAKDGTSFNNMSAVVQYRAANGTSMLWLGDLETSFMEAIEDDIALDKCHIVFAPHHGRDSGKIPNSWLDKLKPDIVVIGEAPSRHLNYYNGYQKITQNRAGHIIFDLADTNKVHIYSSEEDYTPATCDLDDESQSKFDNNYYIGTLNI